MRPFALAQDDTPMLPVIEHAVDFVAGQGWEPEIIVLLQPTSPLRTAAHIRAAVQELRDSGADSVVTVVELPRHLSPDYVMRVDEGRLVPFLPEGTTHHADGRMPGGVCPRRHRLCLLGEDAARSRAASTDARVVRSWCRRRSRSRSTHPRTGWTPSGGMAAAKK